MLVLRLAELSEGAFTELLDNRTTGPVVPFIHGGQQSNVGLSVLTLETITMTDFD